MKVKNGMEEQFVREDRAEDASRDGLQERRLEEAELDRDEAEDEAQGRQRERHRVPDEHEHHQPREHQGRHPLQRDHCSGLS